MTLLGQLICQELLKQASSYRMAKERQFIPRRPERPTVEREQTGVKTYKAQSEDIKGNSLINWGRNKEDHSGYLPLTDNRLLDYHNSISGTGSGNPYWGEKRNPFE